MSISGRTADTSEHATPTVAAGGVVIDDTDGTARVLVVHRPAHADWSLPKGHLEEGETPVAAAVREVEEETGVQVVVTGDAGTTEYRFRTVRDGTTVETHKRVHWFTMRPVPGAADPSGRAADSEVDVAAWWSASGALTDLSYADERRLVARLLDRDR